MKTLPALNTSRFWCSCQLGPADDCKAHHVAKEIATPGSRTRHYLYLAGIAVVSVMVLAFRKFMGE